MKYSHRMPFGAQLLEGGGTRFRLWAPSAERIDLVIDGSTRAELPMRKVDGGWYENVVSNIGVGARYAFRVNGGLTVPDPASRSNPDDVHAASEVIDPFDFDWQEGEGKESEWKGRPWEETVIYELHLGTFTPEGTLTAAERRLDYLADLGVTAIELMPLAQFAGKRGWGYDGVLPFAPENAYGRPNDLKRFVQAAHRRGLMVFLDVVYNHFGPEGNYLHSYAADFFNSKHQTPWGAAINYDGANARTVRDFFIHNALYWIEEYRFDGLRLDAVHAIADDSEPHFIAELAAALQEGPGARRHVHLVLENEHNEAHFLARTADDRPSIAHAQWNDDTHHCFHVLLTGEKDGYYADYARRPLQLLGRCLAEGFAYQGEPSALRRGQARGEPSNHLPASAFVNFLQNHDQVGNRAFGERLSELAPTAALEASAACLLLAPAVPLLFMGEEFKASAPFLYFCDFGEELGAAVTKGRREEFGRFARFSDPAVQASIPDPVALASFERSKLDWQELDERAHSDHWQLYKHLLELRQRHIVPRLAGIKAAGHYAVREDGALAAHWTLGDGARLHLRANLSAAPLREALHATGTRLYVSAGMDDAALEAGLLPAWSVVWSLEMPVETPTFYV